MKFIPLFSILFLAMLIIAGVVVDSGGEIQTMQEAMSIAQSAARAGTNAATGTSVNGDAFDLSGPMAAQAADDYLTTAGVHGTAGVQGDQVTVTVTMTYRPRILGTIGIGPIPVHATGTARLIGN